MAEIWPVGCRLSTLLEYLVGCDAHGPVNGSIWKYLNSFNPYNTPGSQFHYACHFTDAKMEEQRGLVFAERRHCCFKMLELDHILVYPLQVRRASLVSLVALHGSRVRVYFVVVHTVQLCMSIGAFVSTSQNKYAWGTSARGWHDIIIRILLRFLNPGIILPNCAQGNCDQKTWVLAISVIRKTWAREIVCLIKSLLHKSKDPGSDLHCPWENPGVVSGTYLSILPDLWRQRQDTP